MDLGKPRLVIGKKAGAGGAEESGCPAALHACAGAQPVLEDEQLGPPLLQAPGRAVRAGTEARSRMTAGTLVAPSHTRGALSQLLNFSGPPFLPHEVKKAIVPGS